MRQVSVLIMDGDPDRRALHRERVGRSGHQVVAEAETQSQATTLARALRPDLVLIDLRSPTASAWEVARLLDAERQSALALVGEATDATLFWEAPLPSVMAFFLESPAPSQLQATLPLGVLRFRERSTVEEELRDMGERMEARKLVGRAKAILMERQNLSERDAFRRIQSQSLSLNKPVHEIARAIITASEISTGTGAPQARATSDKTTVIMDSADTEDDK